MQERISINTCRLYIATCTWFKIDTSQDMFIAESLVEDSQPRASVESSPG